MTKAEIVNEVAKTTGIEKTTVAAVVESFMECVKGSLAKGNPVYLRGFGRKYHQEHYDDYSCTQHSCIQACKGIRKRGKISITL